MLVHALCQPRRAGDAADVAAIRPAARPKTAVGITGCWAQRRHLSQAREGGRGPVSQLYHRIAADPRHTDVELLSLEDISERRFASWSMGHVDLKRLNPALLLKYSERGALDPFAVSGRVSMALFEEMIATASIAGQG